MQEKEALQNKNEDPKNNPAYWEVAHNLYPLINKPDWNISSLISAAEKAEVHLSGWPIGVTLNRNDARPKAMNFGIKASIQSQYDPMYDYWELHKNGQFYFKRTLEEGILTYDGKPASERIFHFDTRIRRITEALLHCKMLYEALGVDPKMTIHFYVNHYDLKGRILRASEQGRHLSMNYKCEENEHKFKKICSTDLIATDLKGLVFEISTNLFGIFNWLSYSKTVCDGIVDKFTAGA